MSREALPVALVFGALVRKDGAPSAALRRRALHAAELWHAGLIGRVLASGAAREGGPSEAEVIARLCRATGVPGEALVLEERARTTQENVVFAAPVLAAMAAEHVVLVTDRAHAPRARLVARRQGLQVSVSCPTAPITRHTGRTWAREVVAYAWYWLSGAGRR